MIEVTDKAEILEKLLETQRRRPKINAVLITVYHCSDTIQPEPYPFEFKSYNEAMAFIRELDIKDVYKIRVVVEPFRPVQYVEPRFEVYNKGDEDE